MKVLTVKQPHASAIFAKLKGVENRSRRTKHRGKILIHAGLSKSDLHLAAKLYPGLDTSELPTGCIIGEVEIVDDVTPDQLPSDRLAVGPRCWVLRRPRSIKPIPLRGKLGMFEYRGSVEYI